MSGIALGLSSTSCSSFPRFSLLFSELDDRRLLSELDDGRLFPDMDGLLFSRFSRLELRLLDFSFSFSFSFSLPVLRRFFSRSSLGLRFFLCELLFSLRESLSSSSHSSSSSGIMRRALSVRGREADMPMRDVGAVAYAEEGGEKELDAPAVDSPS
jgi:hypothetical protein